MICPDCLENENKEVEMYRECFTQDTYDHRGVHKEVYLGEYWVCPECDNDLPVIYEPDEDTSVQSEAEYRNVEAMPGMSQDGE